MLTGSFELQVAMSRHSQQLQHPPPHQDAPHSHRAWAAEQGEWQRREAAYREQLERHYWAQHEAEYQDSVAEYYAARRHHQEQQHRLNQVLYGFGASRLAPPPSTTSAQPCHPHLQQYQHQHIFQQHHQQQPYQQHQPQQQQEAEGMDCCGAPAASPRPPLTAVSCNAGAGPPGWPGAGMAWEASPAAAGGGMPRKRSQEAADWSVAGMQGGCWVGRLASSMLGRAVAGALWAAGAAGQ